MVNCDPTFYKILVIDDDSDIALVISKSLKELGLQVSSFTEPLLAMAHFMDNPKKYNLILSDIRMPGLSGIEVAKEIRKVESQVKIILMTAFEIPKKDFEKQIKSVKVDELIYKPISVERLKIAVLKNIGINAGTNYKNGN
jgi:CheY-like chemotaxis protein